MLRSTRRSFLAGGMAAFGALAGPAAAQVVPTLTRFSDVAVDVAPLYAQGLGVYADFLRTALLAETRAAFADRLGGPGPRLVVRIRSVFLNSYVGGGGGAGGGGRGRGGGGGGDNDYLDGEALIVGPRGEILATHPQLATAPSSSGGAWYDPASERRRTAVLASHYAQWLRRAL